MVKVQVICAALSMMFTRPTPDFSICEGYGIDPDFAKAVAVVESGWMHDSNLAIRKNNIYGLIGKSFSSIDECIHYFCRLIKTKYRTDDVDVIARKYCPPNSEEWARKVRGIMWKLKNLIH